MRRDSQALDPEIRTERLQALVEMLNSEGWRRVARPALIANMNEIARAIAVSRTADLERLRELQAEYALLARLVTRPKSFFYHEGRPGQEEANAALEPGEAARDI